MGAIRVDCLSEVIPVPKCILHKCNKVNIVFMRLSTKYMFDPELLFLSIS